MTKKAKPPERPMLNGYPIYEDGEECPGCGAVQHQTEADKANGDPAGYALTCPECYRDGCEQCMPCGRGVKCPECEEKERTSDPPIRRPWPRTGRRVETINGVRNWWVYRLGPREWEAREFLNEELQDRHPFKRLKNATSWCLARRRMVQSQMEGA
jgi:hypothetical protein